jgi:Mrp family chromosome partitioning ATPase
MTLLRKHIVWLVLALMAGVGGAVLLHEHTPVRYTSTARVDVEPNIPALKVTYVLNMVTQLQLATSGNVLAGAAHTLGTTPVALQKDVSATVSGTSATGGNANVLSINCSMPTAVSAQHCAGITANAYIDYSNDVGAPLAQPTDPILATLVTSATLPAAPSGVGQKILLPVGAILGLLLGIGAVFLRDYYDHRVRDGADMERLLDAQVLAVIPRAKHSADGFTRYPLSAMAESYRYFREHLSMLIASVPTSGAVLLVTSGRADDGCTSVAANLAVAMAESGARVLLVDADLSHPSLGRVFAAGSRPGWSDLLARRALLDEVAVPVPNITGLRLVTAGDVAVRTPEVFRGTRLVQAFLEMRAQADVVILDSAPVLSDSHTIMLARASDIVAIVADVRRTTRADVSAAAQQVRAMGPSAIIGALNGVASPVNGRARPAPARAAAVAPVAEVPAILAATVPPRGANGHPEPLGGSQVYRRERSDAETDANDGPGA